MNSSPRDARFVAEHSEAVGALVEDDVQRAKLDGVDLRHLITYADLDDLAARGRAFALENPGALDEAIAAIQEDDLFTYIYTSGTTGPPKACMITHRNYYAMIAVVDELDDFLISDDVMLLYLPLAHNFGRLMHLNGAYSGLTIAFCSDPYAVAEALPHVRPTILPSVPRVYEKVHSAVTAAFAAETGVKRRIIDWALRVGRRVSRLRRENARIPILLRPQHRMADRLVYSKVQA